MSLEKLDIEPIGYIRNSMSLKYDAPSQPEASGAESVIELLPGKGFHQALSDLEGFERIWLLWWFHHNTSWRPMVLPPRGSDKRRGLFATRSPHRPNPIGISAVKLISISKLKITIGPCDLMDGTPILDIKPYISKVDSFPDSKCGWLEDVEKAQASSQIYEITFTPLASQQMEWLEQHNIKLTDRLRTIIGINPFPHRTRRIKKIDENLYRIGCGAWRLFYSVGENEIQIKNIAPGYPTRTLIDESKSRVPFREEQLRFQRIWPS